MANSDARQLRIGGESKSELLTRLSQRGVLLNDYAEDLFADPAFDPASEPKNLNLIEVSLPEIGLPEGGRFDQILAQAARFGLEPCPLEVGPHLRLEHLDQPRGQYLTVASHELHPGTDRPNGFYLRHLDDGLWLRGYESGPDNLYPPDFTDFVFTLADG